MKANANIVIIGRNYSTSLGVIRAVGFAGYTVDYVKLTNGNQRFISPEAKSKFVREYFTTPASDEKRLINLLIHTVADKNQKKIIIPADDLSAYLLDCNADRLLEYFMIPQLDGSNGTLKYYMNKTVQKELASRCGLPVAKGWTVSIDSQGEYVIPEHICYPCYTKPRTSIGYPKTYIRKCDNEKELCKLLEEIANNGACVILVEEYLEIDKEYTVPGVSFDGKVDIPGFIEKIKIGEGAHKGVTAIGKVIDVSVMPETKRLLNVFISHLRLVGLFDIELIKCKDMIYFNELNLRNSAASFAITSAGVNLPGKLVDFLLKKKTTSNPDVLKNGVIFASEKVLFENYVAGYSTWKQYKSDIKSTDFSFMKCKEDMAPYRSFLMLTIRRRVKEFLKG